MPLYLAATPDRLTRAAVTPRLPTWPIVWPGSELLAAPLPPALRGGLMVLSDWDCPPVEEPDRLARQIARTCLRRGYAGAAADFDPPARPGPSGSAGGAFSPAGLLRPGPCMSRSTAPSPGRRYCCAPPCPAERWRPADPGGGPIRGGAPGPDLQRLAMDFPLPCPGGQGTPLTLPQLEAWPQAAPPSIPTPCAPGISP